MERKYKIGDVLVSRPQMEAVRFSMSDPGRLILWLVAAVRTTEAADGTYVKYVCAGANAAGCVDGYHEFGEVELEPLPPHDVMAEANKKLEEMLANVARAMSGGAA